MNETHTALAAGSNIVRVLVVDDSAYVRKMMTQMLTRNPFVEVVGTARDGREALELAEELSPQVITCDLNMPEMDGVAFVREQMSRKPTAIVIISVANPAAAQVLEALEAGAVDFLQKPTALANDRILEVAEDLVAKVKAAAYAPMARLAPAAAAAAPIAPLPVVPRTGEGRADVLVIGVSTGGPQALKSLIPRFSADLPVPIAIVMHMPVGYTELYAKKLNELSQVTVKEAERDDLLLPGVAYLAPAGRHMSFRRSGTEVRVHLDARPLDTAHRPSVDVMFQSAAEIFGARVLGAVLTGMGSDGREGAAWIKARGGQVVTESEPSCVVYGMPRSVVEAGLSDLSATLETMAGIILGRL